MDDASFRSHLVLGTGVDLRIGPRDWDSHPALNLQYRWEPVGAPWGLDRHLVLIGIAVRIAE